MDGDTYTVIPSGQLPPGPMANPSMPAATGVAQHIAEIAAQENVVATGGGAAAAQYNATQPYRK
jgi:hypothetical protein